MSKIDTIIDDYVPIEIDSPIPRKPTNIDFFKYFDDTSILSKSAIRQELIDLAIPIPFDYFHDLPSLEPSKNRLIYYPDQILNLPIANELNLTETDLSVNYDNVDEVIKLLTVANPMQILPYSILNGVIAATAQYVILIGLPNNEGYPGRLFIIYSKNNCREESSQRGVVDREPLDYVDIMRDIKTYKYNTETLFDSIESFKNLLTECFPCYPSTPPLSYVGQVKQV